MFVLARGPVSPNSAEFHLGPEKGNGSADDIAHRDTADVRERIQNEGGHERGAIAYRVAHVLIGSKQRFKLSMSELLAPQKFYSVFYRTIESFSRVTHPIASLRTGAAPTAMASPRLYTFRWALCRNIVAVPRK